MGWMDHYSSRLHIATSTSAVHNLFSFFHSSSRDTLVSLCLLLLLRLLVNADFRSFLTVSYRLQLLLGALASGNAGLAADTAEGGRVRAGAGEARLGGLARHRVGAAQARGGRGGRLGCDRSSRDGRSGERSRQRRRRERERVAGNRSSRRSRMSQRRG